MATRWRGSSFTTKAVSTRTPKLATSEATRVIERGVSTFVSPCGRKAKSAGSALPTRVPSARAARFQALAVASGGCRSTPGSSACNASMNQASSAPDASAREIPNSTAYSRNMGNPKANRNTALAKIPAPPANR